MYAIEIYNYLIFTIAFRFLSFFSRTMDVYKKRGKKEEINNT